MVGQLAADYATHLALLQAAGGSDLAVKIDALMKEQRQAETALDAPMYGRSITITHAASVQKSEILKQPSLCRFIFLLPPAPRER